jgi:hypothetical protein
MELFQLYWDDKQNLFLEFEKSKEENQIFLNETVKRVNIRYEISKFYKREVYQNNMPYLVSINRFCFYNEFMVLSIDLSEISDIEDIQIKILCLTIFLYSGKKYDIIISKNFILSEVSVNEDLNFEFNDRKVKAKGKNGNSIVKEKIIQEHETDFENKKEKSTYIYEKNSRIKDPADNSIISMVLDNTETLKSIVEQLKELNSTLKTMSLQSYNITAYDSPLIGPPKRYSSQEGSERTKTNIIQKINAELKPPGEMYFLPELKDLIKNNEDIRKVLKPMSEEELHNITLNDEKLKEKQELAFQRHVVRIEKEKKNKKSKEIILENLKKPD